MLNEHFSQEHADAQHKGLESENNRYHDWEDEFEITDKVNSVDVEHYSEYLLKGFNADDSPFEYPIPNMLIFNLGGDTSQVGQLAFSESIVEMYELDRENGRLGIYIKDLEPHANPIPGVYIASLEFPKELID